MSVMLLSGRKKAIAEKKKVVRKVGTLAEGKAPKMTAAWKVNTGGKKASISFSRDNMNVYVDGSPIECTAYVTDNGYDLDLLFGLGDNKGHIYSDVEGSEMTNYLFFDDQLIAQDKQTNLKSNHRPDGLPMTRHPIDTPFYHFCPSKTDCGPTLVYHVYSTDHFKSLV